MSVLLLNSTETTRLMTVGASHSYCFYQQLNVSPTHPTTTLRSTKQIVPSIPRKHFKPPPNSSLSPIRQQKIMPKNNDTPNPKEKRPYPLLTTFSSPAYIQTELVTKKEKKVKNTRKRKVSFDEKVVVICTIFDAEEDEKDEIKSGEDSNSEEEEEEEEDEEKKVEERRHSTGEIKPSVFIDPSTKSLRKVTRSLKQFKNRLLLN